MELIIICSRFVQTSNINFLKAKWRKASSLILNLIFSENSIVQLPIVFFNQKNTFYSHYCQAVISRPTNFLLGLVFQSVIVETKRLQHTIWNNTRSEQKCENIYLDNVKFISVTILKRAKYITTDEFYLELRNLDVNTIIKQNHINITTIIISFKLHFPSNV
jgi:hypothetical protein